MGLVATITISGASFSVYAKTSTTTGLTDANDYFKGHFDAAEWTAADNATKSKALVTAFRMIEVESWTGAASGATAYPRTGITKSGVAVADGTPDDIVHGQYELALALLKDTAVLSKVSTFDNVKSVKAGSASVTFHYPQTGSATRYPLQAHRLLSPYFAGRADTSILGPLTTGTDQSTSFDDLDMERSEGFA